MLAITDHWLRAELKRNHTCSSAEKPKGEVAYFLDPTDHQVGLCSSINLQT